MHEGSRKSTARVRRLIAAATAVAIGSLLPLAAGAQTPAPARMYIGNADGTCTYHKHITESAIEDIQIGNGQTYHQDALVGKKSGITYSPDLTFLCKGGQLFFVK